MPRISVKPLLKDGPLDPSFWFGEIDARCAGIFRLGLGGLLLGDALLALPHLDALYGSRGVWLPEQGFGPLTALPDAGLVLVWLLGCLALTCFTLGLFSRPSALLSFCFLVSVHQRTVPIATGGDFLGQILVFFCIFLDSGAAFSLDARWFGKGRAFVPAGPWRAMQLHLALLYFATARLKLRGDWATGHGLYLSLQLKGFLRPLGALLVEYPRLCRLMNWAVIGLEGAFAFFAFSPLYNRRLRWGAAACGLLVQLGILSTMRVGVFTPIMIWCAVLFVPGARAPVGDELELAPRRIWLTAAPVLAVVLMAWGAFIGRRVPLPGALSRGMEQVGLFQPYQLFGNSWEVAEWHARGVGVAGEEADVLRLAGSGLRSQVGWSYSPFYKLTFFDRLRPEPIALWLCREYARQGGQPLRSIELWKDVRPALLPGQNGEVRRAVLYSGACEQ